MRVCFDANVLIDIFGRSEWFFDSFAAYDVANLRRYESFIPSTTTTDIAYVLHRRGLSENCVRAQMLPRLFEMFDVFDVSGADCESACASSMADYEDALIAQAASRNGIDLIVTRNVKDFVESPVAAMTPAEFVRRFKPDNIEYDETDLG